MREVIIYGIREVGTEPLLYVGASTDLKARRAVGYSPRVSRALAKITWEYTVLEVTNLEEAAARERWWIDAMRSAGHPLRNTSVPGPTHHALPVAPTRSGKSGSSGLPPSDRELAERGIGRITLRMKQSALDHLSRIAKSRGCTRATVVEDLIASLEAVNDL